jgi:hypothetical protein
MVLSNHAKTRMIQRHKAASFMKPSQLNALITSAVKFDKAVKRNHGFKAEYYLIDSIGLVLVLNPLNNVVVTCYEKD